MGGKTRPLYPAEFRSDAVRLFRSAGKTIAEVARDLGVSTESLRNWLKQDDRDAGRRKVWRVLRVAESRFRRLDAPELLAGVHAGRRFVDGTHDHAHEREGRLMPFAHQLTEAPKRAGVTFRLP